MFGKQKELKALAAVKGVSANELTEEQLAAVNAEFESEGLELTAVAKGDTGYTQAQLDEAVATAKTEAESAMSEKVADLEATIESNAAQAQKDSARIAELEAKAHGDKAPKKDGDAAHDGNTESKTPMLDAITASAKARAGKK